MRTCIGQVGDKAAEETTSQTTGLGAPETARRLARQSKFL
jgi:hypothetical protein